MRTPLWPPALIAAAPLGLPLRGAQTNFPATAWPDVQARTYEARGIKTGRLT